MVDTQKTIQTKPETKQKSPFASHCGKILVVNALEKIVFNCLLPYLQNVEILKIMRTHENSDPDDVKGKVEFCFDHRYYQFNENYSESYTNATPFQAWRAGFREGVKMCLDRGAHPTLQEFESKVHHRNYDHLCIWQSVGADVENGFWAMYGARLGTYMTMLRDWDHKQVQDFDHLAYLWESFSRDDEQAFNNIGESLRTKLGLHIVDLTAEQSKFFKHHYKSQFTNKGPMARE